MTRWLLALLAVGLTACGARYVEYHSATEIPQGRGMLTGEKGALVLYSDQERHSAETPRGKEAALDKKSGAAPAVRSPATGSDAREFEKFQAFKRWKKANRNSPEYRKFKEWQEWQAYRAWKREERR